MIHFKNTAPVNNLHTNELSNIASTSLINNIQHKNLDVRPKINKYMPSNFTCTQTIQNTIKQSCHKNFLENDAVERVFDKLVNEPGGLAYTNILKGLSRNIREKVFNAQNRALEKIEHYVETFNTDFNAAITNNRYDLINQDLLPRLQMITNNVSLQLNQTKLNPLNKIHVIRFLDLVPMKQLESAYLLNNFKAFRSNFQAFKMHELSLVQSYRSRVFRKIAIDLIFCSSYFSTFIPSALAVTNVPRNTTHYDLYDKKSQRELFKNIMFLSIIPSALVGILAMICIPYLFDQARKTRSEMHIEHFAKSFDPNVRYSN